jgi:hypothetical protein
MLDAPGSLTEMTGIKLASHSNTVNGVRPALWLEE